MEKIDLLEASTTRFKDKHWRMTSGVKNIVQVLSKTDVPLSPADIVNELDKQEKTIDLATVYRIMERLETIGIAKRVIGKFMPTADPFNEKESEHFMICQNTGRAESIFLNYHNNLAQQLQDERGFSLERTDITFFGTKETLF